ncbi:MAG: hypothetical protein A2Z96_01545 [Spirochaetes bacterium GWB1_48_6]|nr:MAG: hypothetical protein A2Z96_01545 [Spirochaetes bacterium GWB1_48_6]
MAVPLNYIVNFKGNIYEITNAVIKRAKQLTEIGDEDLETHQGKAVSAAIDQVFSTKVAYHIED